MNMNATILGRAIAFILFVWFCMKYVWPPLMAAIENVRKKLLTVWLPQNALRKIWTLHRPTRQTS